MSNTITTRPVNTVVQLPTYHPDIYITRDTTVNGTLKESCDLWIERPRYFADAVVGSESKGGVWLNRADVAFNQCYLGTYTVEAVRKWCGTVPDDHRMCIKVAGRMDPEVA